MEIKKYLRIFRFDIYAFVGAYIAYLLINGVYVFFSGIPLTWRHLIITSDLFYIYFLVFIITRYYSRKREGFL